MEVWDGDAVDIVKRERERVVALDMERVLDKGSLNMSYSSLCVSHGPGQYGD
jgi:hypothetical protein